METALLFLFVFNFGVPGVGIPSMFVAMAFICFIDFYKHNGLAHYKIKKIDDETFLALALFFLVLIFSLARTFLGGAKDPTYFYELLKLPIYAMFAYFYASHLVHNNKNLKSLLVKVFLIQAIIILASLFSPEAKLFFDIFRSDASIESSLRYSGTRGLAVSSVIYFGLAIVYSVFFIYVASQEIKRKNLFVLAFLFIFLSSFTIARTALIGYFLSHVILLATNREVLKRLLFVYLFCLFPMVIYVIINPDLFNIITKQLEFVFEFAFNYMETGELRTNSTDVLSTMYYPLEESTLLIGDGKYTADDGVRYYGRTDAGYMRNFLYFGSFSVFLYLFQIILNHKLSALLVKNNLKRMLFFIVLTFMTFIFHYKGDVIGMAKPFYTIFFLIFFYHYLIERKSQIET